MLSEGFLKFSDDFQHLLLVLLREVFLHVHLAYGLSEYVVRHAHGSLPTGLLFGDSAHRGAEEVELGGVEIV